MQLLQTSELQVGDYVKQDSELLDRHFDTCIVKQVTDEKVTLFRPYGATADFTYTGGVICYIGIEEYSVSRDDTRTQWILFRRSDLK